MFVFSFECSVWPISIKAEKLASSSATIIIGNNYNCIGNSKYLALVSNYLRVLQPSIICSWWRPTSFSVNTVDNISQHEYFLFGVNMMIWSLLSYRYIHKQSLFNCLPSLIAAQPISFSDGLHSQRSKVDTFKLRMQWSSASQTSAQDHCKTLHAK